MKKILHTLLFLCTLLASSCNDDFLDQEPLNRLDESAVWDDPILVDLFLNSIYGNLLSSRARLDQPQGNEWSRSFSSLDCASDDCDGKLDAFIQNYLKNTITPSSDAHFSEQWREGYSLIRKASVLIDRVDEVPTNDPGINAQMKAEARFLRAFAHFELAKFFGDVPIIDREYTLNDNLLVSRSSFEDVIGFIVSEMDLAIPDLPDPDVKSGRATKGAAMAVKAKALLYLASPLHTPGGDAARWTAAANAAKAVIDLNAYSLHPDFARVIRDKGNAEIIWDRQFSAPNRTTNISYMWEIADAGPDGGGWGGLFPTAELVNSFETTDGRTITDPLSIYDPNRPYENRDKRLEATVIYNGQIYKGFRVEIWNDDDDTFEQLTDDGQHAIDLPGAGNKITTGYGLGRKIQNEELNTNALVNQGDDGNDVFIRYADILLMFAEARNEASGPDAAVYDAVNQVRTRAGQPDLTTGLSQADMRDKIINERRVELAFEEHRLFDLKRWKLAPVYLNSPMRGHRALPVDLAQAQNYNLDRENNQSPYRVDGGAGFTYSEFDLPGRDRIWDDKRYFFPVPQAEIDKNPNLLPQNPGW